MTTPEEVARIKREALEDVAQWMRDAEFSQWEREAFASYRQKHYPAPSPAAAETREWWINVYDDGRQFLHRTENSAKASLYEDRRSGTTVPVVPRAELENEQMARRVDVATIQATADALYGDERPSAWQTKMPSTVSALRASLDAMLGERDQWEKSYHEAERHNDLLRDTVEAHGNTIRDLRAHLREATERSELAREALCEMGEFRDWYCAEMQTVEDAKAATGMSLWLSLRHALEERATLRAQLAAATGPVSRETVQSMVDAWLGYGNNLTSEFEARMGAAIEAMGRKVEGA